MKILIIEDESIIAQRIERLVRRVLPNDKLQFHTCSELDDGLEYIKEHSCDLLFLDLNINGEDGFEILSSMVAQSFQTIIISANTHRALEAFEYGVLDFIAKPFDEDRVRMALARLTEHSQHPQAIKFLAVNKRHRRILIEVTTIKFIKGAGIYTELHLKNNTVEIHNKSLENLSLILPKNFVRIHKSYIANMNLSKQIIVHAGSKYELLLDSEDKLPIGRTRYKELKEQWFA